MRRMLAGLVFGLLVGGLYLSGHAQITQPGGGFPSTVVAKTASYSASLGDFVEFTSGSSLTLTLPAASGCSSTNLGVALKNDTANGSITVARAGSDTIDGATSFTTSGAQFEAYTFVCNAAKTGWMVY